MTDFIIFADDIESEYLSLFSFDVNKQTYSIKGSMGLLKSSMNIL